MRGWVERGLLRQNDTFLLLVLTPQNLVFQWKFPRKKGFQLAMARNPENPQNGQNVHGFKVRTPIFHIVPVSHAYLYALQAALGANHRPGRTKNLSAAPKSWFWLSFKGQGPSGDQLGEGFKSLSTNSLEAPKVLQ